MRLLGLFSNFEKKQKNQIFQLLSIMSSEIANLRSIYKRSLHVWVSTTDPGHDPIKGGVLLLIIGSACKVLVALSDFLSTNKKRDALEYKYPFMQTIPQLFRHASGTQHFHCHSGGSPVSCHGLFLWPLQEESPCLRQHKFLHFDYPRSLGNS